MVDIGVFIYPKNMKVDKLLHIFLRQGYTCNHKYNFNELDCKCYVMGKDRILHQFYDILKYINNIPQLWFQKHHTSIYKHYRKLIIVQLGNHIYSLMDSRLDHKGI